MTSPRNADADFPVPLRIQDTETWDKLSVALKEGRFPQALALRVPSGFFLDLTSALARELLCLKRGEDEPCRSCQSWSGEEHPDLLLSGPSEEPPSIDRCRELWGELSLKPVVASRRVAVCFNADRLSPGAANSMLKMTEEPPGNSVIILLHETGEILPTLRSRTWNLSISIDEIIAPAECPQSPGEWATWLARTSKLSVAQIDIEIQGMVSFLLKAGRTALAEDLETIRLYARKGNLSVTMIQDFVFLLLKEEKPIGQLFADLW